MTLLFDFPWRPPWQHLKKCVMIAQSWLVDLGRTDVRRRSGDWRQAAKPLRGQPQNEITNLTTPVEMHDEVLRLDENHNIQFSHDG
jgi:hypothetical protein